MAESRVGQRVAKKSKASNGRTGRAGGARGTDVLDRGFPHRGGDAIRRDIWQCAARSSTSLSGADRSSTDRSDSKARPKSTRSPPVECVGPAEKPDHDRG